MTEVKKEQINSSKELQLHIAAMSPSILSSSEFDEVYIAKETEAFQNQIKVENEERGRLGKHLKKCSLSL